MALYSLFWDYNGAKCLLDTMSKITNGRKVEGSTFTPSKVHKTVYRRKTYTDVPYKSLFHNPPLMGIKFSRLKKI